MSEIVTGKDALIARLEDENTRLRRELAEKDQAVEQERQAVLAGVTNLRRQLSPLYTALRQVFGEIDAMGMEDSAPAPAASLSAPDARLKAVWDSWKNKLGLGPAKCIDALLLHGELTTQQLSIATGYHRNTVPQYVSALHTAGLINKNGGRFSLKAL